MPYCARYCLTVCCAAIARLDPAGPLHGLRAVARAKAHMAAGERATLAALVLQRCRTLVECLPDFCKCVIASSRV